MALSTSSVGRTSRGRGWKRVYSRPQGNELTEVLASVSERVTDVQLRTRVKNAITKREALSDTMLKDFNNHVRRGTSLDQAVRRLTGSSR